MAPTIRLAVEQDADALVSILIASKEASFPEVVEAHDRDVPFWIRRWRRYITSGSQAQESLGDGWVFIAEQAGTPVGFAAYHHTRRYNTDAELQSIYVLKEWQKQAIGMALLGAISYRLAADGSRSMCVGFDPNLPYKQFYFKHGAIEVAPGAAWAIWPNVEDLAARLPRPDEKLMSGLRREPRRAPGRFWRGA